MAGKPEGPLWLQLVHRLERAVGEPVESAVRSDTYFDVVAQANRARARMTRLVETVSEEWLHLFNLPAGSDIRKLREQVARLERELADVAKELADRDADGRGGAASASDATPSVKRATRSRQTKSRASRKSAS
jgi:hypothetical protein